MKYFLTTLCILGLFINAYAQYPSPYSAADTVGWDGEDIIMQGDSYMAFPNPSSDFVNIGPNEGTFKPETEIRVYSGSGQLVTVYDELGDALPLKAIYLGDLTHGSYLVHISTPGEDTEVLRVVKW